LKTLKYLGVATVLATTLATAGHAGNTVTFAGAGSSALWKITEQSAVAKSGYTNHYSLAGGAFIQDTNGVAGGEKGNIWIAWSGSTGNYTIAYDVQVDSTVGDRAFFNNDRITVTRGASDQSGYAGSSDTTPPSEVFDAVQAAAINIALTDITPSDALVATARSMSLGYDKTHPILSFFKAGETATPVAFNTASRGFQLISIGASPVIVFVNTTDTSATGLGAIANTPGGTEYRSNIDRFTLAGFLSGQLGRTTDINSDKTLGTGTAVTTIIREPLSGTYNTMEYCIPESAEGGPFTGGKGQELGVTTNPVNQTASGGKRQRAIGTGESIKNANLIANSLGYAFWSFPNFSAAPSLRYLTVDGVDPLFDNYSVSGNEGNLQPSGTPTFRNIKNGGYPIWSILRAVTDATEPAGISTILGNLPAGDFVKSSELEVFRSYHATPDATTPSNGNVSGTTAAGGDVGGAVFPVNADIDFANDASAELTDFLQ
jgi:hypothetical protein